jgi:hypothetical protein
MFILLLCLLLNLCVCEEWTTEKVIAAIEDPPLRDILESAVKKLEGLKAESQTELKEVYFFIFLSFYLTFATD